MWFTDIVGFGHSTNTHLLDKLNLLYMTIHNVKESRLFFTVISAPIHPYITSLKHRPWQEAIIFSQNISIVGHSKVHCFNVFVGRVGGPLFSWRGRIIITGN